MSQIKILFHVRLYFLLCSVLLNNALLLNKSDQSSKITKPCVCELRAYLIAQQRKSRILQKS
jgi:hypothetical protein